MQINYWKNRVADTYKEKFQNQDWSIQDRILSVVSQCASLAEKVQFNQGKRKINKQHESDAHLVMDILLDVLILCSNLDIDIDKNLEDTLQNLKKVER